MKRILLLSILFFSLFGVSEAKFDKDLISLYFESFVSIIEGNNSSFQCGMDGYECTKKHSTFQTKKANSTTYYICSGGDFECNGSKALYTVKKQNNTYYVCGGNKTSCNFENLDLVLKNSNNDTFICSSIDEGCTNINSLYRIKKSSNSYYFCKDDYSCSNDNDISQLKKQNNKYYRCAGNTDACSSYNAITQTLLNGNTSSSSSSNFSNSSNSSSFTIDDDPELKAYFNAFSHCKNTYGDNATADEDLKCICMDGYMRNSNKTSCIKYEANQSCANQFGQYSIAAPDAPGYCTCKDGYTRNDNETSCIKIDYNQNCVKLYGQYAMAAPDAPGYCTCKDGYTMNDSETSCIKIEVNDYTTSNQSNGDTSSITNTSNNNGYSQEYNAAYQFAYENKITTMPTIEQANMNGEIIRAEIAKMLSNWMKSLGKTPNTLLSCNFKDISGVKGDLYTAVIESCQLGIMGQGIDEFRPFDKITKGEVATAVSRIIWGDKHNGGEPFYWKHMNALKDAGILKDTANPEVNELRGNVMVTLMNASNSNEFSDCDDPAVLLACSLKEKSCPERCRPSLEVIVANNDSKIIANQDSKLDSLLLLARNGDLKLSELGFYFKGDYSLAGSKVWLTNNEKVVSSIETINEEGDAYITINDSYQAIKQDDFFDVTIMINTNIPSGKKIRYYITRGTDDNEYILPRISGNPKTYES